jgi:hypothetical protein
MCGVLAQADQWDKQTKITVDEAIEVPGAVLPAGTYVFRLVDSPSDRHIVQVFNANQDHVFATILAIPNYRLEPTGKTALSFYEVPAGNPVPVHAWFYPGDNSGQEFVYPADRTFKVSQTGGTATITRNPIVEETLEPLPAPAAAVEVETAQIAPQTAPAIAPVEETPAAEPVVVAVNEPPVMPGTPVMPETSDNFPLLGLSGLLLIGGALTLGAFTKRMG